jgi:hypothetical protein
MAAFRRSFTGPHWPQMADCRPPYRFGTLVRQAFGGDFRNFAPGSAGNEARDTDIPRRLRIRARHSWNPAVTDVIVNT